MNIVLYTTHCPKCKVLEQKLKDKKVEYCICEDIDKMARLGIESVPVLGINENLIDFGRAIRWVNSLEE